MRGKAATATGELPRSPRSGVRLAQSCHLTMGLLTGLAPHGAADGWALPVALPRSRMRGSLCVHTHAQRHSPPSPPGIRSPLRFSTTLIKKPAHGHPVPQAPCTSAPSQTCWVRACVRVGGPGGGWMGAATPGAAGRDGQHLGAPPARIRPSLEAPLGAQRGPPPRRAHQLHPPAACPLSGGLLPAGRRSAHL